MAGRLGRGLKAAGDSFGRMAGQEIPSGEGKEEKEEEPRQPDNKKEAAAEAVKEAKAEQEGKRQLFKRPGWGKVGSALKSVGKALGPTPQS